VIGNTQAAVFSRLALRSATPSAQGAILTEVLMLVLSRKRSESIFIGSDVRVTVLKVEGNHVRIGIEAPDNVVVLRAELVDSGHVRGPNQDEGRNAATTLEF
jgi:carbon storage regulator